MTEFAPVTALGLMSGTSLDGIDAAILRTDGDIHIEPGLALTRTYAPELRAVLRAVLGREDRDDPEVKVIEAALTRAHAIAVLALLSEAGLALGDVRIVGFHGHTISHRPEAGRTLQIGDGQWLATETGIDVVADFRSADMAAGGQGAPLASLYHAARAQAGGLELPLAVLNVGGVANVTWIGPGIGPGGDESNGAENLVAFDTGPGNALIDDWTQRHTGATFDENGQLAAQGTVDGVVLAALLGAPYFDRKPPKSIDRQDFDLDALGGLGAADGAATLAAFTAKSVARAAEHFPAPVARWLVTGGGRHNPVLMKALRRAIGVPVDAVEDVGWNGDAMEAEAFGYLAVRALRGLPLTVPGTTGCRAATAGGRVFQPEG